MIGKLENMSTEIIQYENQREKYWKKLNYWKLWDNIKPPDKVV